MSDTIQLLAVIVGAYLVLLLGRAMAARLAGPQNAEMVLNFVPFPFSILTDLLNALPRSQQMDDDQEIDEETGNTVTLGNTEKHAETPRETQTLMKLSDVGGQRIVPNWSREDWDRLEVARRNAIVLLDRCIKYYRQHPDEHDEGQIPHYKKLGMNAENRGFAVNDLWESGFCSKGSSGTFIHPEVARSCEELYNHIVKRDPKYRVYPYGYELGKKQTLDSAVQAIPENVHG